MAMTKLKPTRSKGNSVEETALLEALLAPGSEAERQVYWNRFVRRYERLIASCVLKVLRRYGAVYSGEDLDDLVGDVWLVLLRDDLRKLRQYDAARGFRIASFVGLVATNTTIDHLRARQVDATPLDELAENHVALEVSVRDTVEEREQAALARAALGQLTVDERSFIFECFHAERSPEELARRLGITTNTVYSRKFKLREKLARIVASLEGAAA
jgi:RNA polymerase sigma factor (sigma-70 family)